MEQGVQLWEVLDLGNSMSLSLYSCAQVSCGSGTRSRPRALIRTRRSLDTIYTLPISGDMSTKYSAGQSHLLFLGGENVGKQRNPILTTRVGVQSNTRKHDHETALARIELSGNCFIV